MEAKMRATTLRGILSDFPSSLLPGSSAVPGAVEAVRAAEDVA
jgi:hypothetical protein